MPIPTRVFPIDPEKPDPGPLAEAAAILRAGGLVAFPTETVYGLGADATNPAAVARIFAAKGRPASNPLIVHVDRKEAARGLVASWPDRAEALADRFWPGPLTLVLPRSSIIPDIVAAGQDTVGLRIPRPLAARMLIHLAGRPIAAPSANRSTGISPTRAGHVLKDLDGKVDLILDAGAATVGLESTVLDLSGEMPRVLRPGSITREAIAEALGEDVGEPEGPSARSPGQMSVHYAPRLPTYRIERGDSLRDPPTGRFVVIAIGPEAGPIPEGASALIRLASPDEANAWFYHHLHESEGPGACGGGLDFLAILPPPDRPEWRALRDRIWRASTPWPG